MPLRNTRTILILLAIILGTGIIGFLFWQSHQYRAATPLVFIFGLTATFVVIGRSIVGLVRRPVGAVRRRLTTKQSLERKLWRNHVPQLITNLYFTHIRQYPEWIRESRDYVPSSVTTAGRTAEEVEQILLYYAQYAFQFVRFPLTDGNAQTGEIRITRESLPLITIKVRRTITKKGLIVWDPTAVTVQSSDLAWIREFENLKAEILAIMKNRAREARES